MFFVKLLSFIHRVSLPPDREQVGKGNAMLNLE